MAITDISDGTKKCSKCGETKNLDAFYKCKNRGKRIPYTSACKECKLEFHKKNPLKKPCPICGDEIHKRAKMCRSCYHKSDVGLKNHKLVSERNKAKKKPSLCIDCGIAIHRQSKRCQRCKSKGVNNPKWDGGVSSLRKIIMSSFEYRQWRSDVFTRDNFTCLECDKRGVALHAHHKVRFSSIMRKNNVMTLEQSINCSELWNINNGSTLCVECHNNLHKTKGYFYGELSEQ